MPDIADWLTSLGLARHAPAFAEHRIELDVVADLSEQDLSELGLPLGDRKRVLRAAARVEAALGRGAGRNGRAAIAPAAERRQLTVMFCDLVGSTPLSTQMDPEDFAELLAAFHGLVEREVAAFGGCVARFMGDGALILFGYPEAHEEDAERAVRAGLMIARGMRSIGSRAVGPQVRIGIATGLVVVGNLAGAGPVRHRDVVGEAPNLAARLQALAAPDSVVIAPSTRHLIGDLFECADLGAIEVKGFAEPVRAWRVLRESAVHSRFEALRSGRTPLVGREQELNTLLRCWREAETGDGRVVLLSGEAGIGKSRLAVALGERVAASCHVRLRYFCSPHRADSALYPIVTQLERAAGFERDDCGATKLAKLERLLGNSSGDLARDVPLFAELLSVPLDSRYRALALSQLRRKELLLERLAAQLRGFSARQPVLVVFEDIHWIDPTSLEALNRVVADVASLPALVIVTHRPEVVPAWSAQPHVTALRLSRLTARENTVMVEKVAGKQLPEAVRDQIVARTDGVPLFVEELTKSVLESGVLREEQDRYALVAALPSFAVPTTLQASLVARLDRLAPVRSVAQTGAALGREFTFSLLQAVSALPEDELRAALDQLVAAELVHQHGAGPEASYSFKHVLVQEAAFETLLRNQRAQIHGRIATVLEERFPEIGERQPDVLAHHCTEAKLWQKAIRYRVLACRMALARSAWEEAAAHVERGRALLAKLPRGAARRQWKFLLRVAVADRLIMTQGFSSPDAGAALLKARELADEAADPLAALRVTCALWSCHFVRAEMDQALALARTLVPDERIGGSAVIADVLVGSSLLQMGRLEEGAFRLERALAAYDEDSGSAVEFIVGHSTRAMIFNWLGWIHLLRGELGDARDTSLRAIDEARRTGNPFALTTALLLSGHPFSMLGDHALTMRSAEEAVAIAREQRFALHLSRADHLRAAALVLEGRIAEAIPMIEAVLAREGVVQARYRRSHHCAILGWLYLQAGAHERAVATVEAAVQELSSSTERICESEILRLKGEVLLGARGDRTAAEACFRRALAVAERHGALLWQLRAAVSLARLWSARGRAADAHALLAPILASFGEAGVFPDLEQAKELLAALAAAQADGAAPPTCPARPRRAPRPKGRRRVAASRGA